jgi:hypothetical protein
MVRCTHPPPLGAMLNSPRLSMQDGRARGRASANLRVWSEERERLSGEFRGFFAKHSENWDRTFCARHIPSLPVRRGGREIYTRHEKRPREAHHEGNVRFT